MFIKFEPTGTHVHKDVLKIRLDFIPEESDKSYATQHVFVVDETSKEFQSGYQGKLDEFGSPVDQKDYDLWIEKLPHIWRTNPCLSHFLTVKPDITKTDLDAIVKSIFTSTVTATIDDSAIQANYAHLISPYMRDKSSATSVKMWDDSIAMAPILTALSVKGTIEPTKATLATAKSDPATKMKVEDSVVTDLNTRLVDYGVVAGTKDAPIDQIKPQSIDVGAGATDRSTQISYGTTFINKTNPANATGTINTVDIWAQSTLAGCEIALFYVESGNSLSTRSNSSFGSVASGSKQTFTGLSLSVSSGDYLGFYMTQGAMEFDNVSGGRWVKTGDKIPCTNETFTSYVNGLFSLYATGTEAAGGWVNIGKINGVTATDIAKVNGIAVADIAKVNGVSV